MEDANQNSEHFKIMSCRSPIKLRSRGKRSMEINFAHRVLNDGTSFERLGKDADNSPVSVKRKKEEHCNTNSSKYFSSNHLDLQLSNADHLTTSEINQACTDARNQCRRRLGSSFYSVSCTDLAKGLLGKILARKLPSGETLKGKIVETECYLGVDDKASHSYKGKQTDRNSAMFMKPGTAYVYTIYGLYYCFNISSREEGSAVLIRSLEPVENYESMRKQRLLLKKSSVKSVKDRDLCNGPSKLCQAFQINKSLNKEDLIISNSLWVEDGENIGESNYVLCKRIGIESAGVEWANKPLRFYIRNCIYVSVRNKQAEKGLT